MPSFNHGALALDLPGEWADRSMIMFSAPEGADHGVVSINISVVEAETAASRLKQKLAELTKVDEAAKLVKEGELRCGLGVGAYYEVSVTMAEVQVRQILGVILKDGLAFDLSASAQEARFEAVSPVLWGILRSVRVGSLP